MKYLLFSALLISTQGFAALNMKPGLWKIDMSITSEGKTINPVKEIEKNMASMPEAERAKMKKDMEKHARFNKEGDIHTCYSKAMMDKPEALGEQKGMNCDSKLVSHTSKQVITSFKCQDGTRGDSTWNIDTPTSYKGVVKVINPAGNESQITYLGKYLKADCGTIKPAL